MTILLTLFLLFQPDGESLPSRQIYWQMDRIVYDDLPAAKNADDWDLIQSLLDEMEELNHQYRAMTNQEHRDGLKTEADLLRNSLGVLELYKEISLLFENYQDVREFYQASRLLTHGTYMEINDLLYLASFSPDREKKLEYLEKALTHPEIYKTPYSDLNRSHLEWLRYWAQVLRADEDLQKSADVYARFFSDGAALNLLKQSDTEIWQEYMQVADMAGRMAYDPDMVSLLANAQRTVPPSYDPSVRAQVDAKLVDNMHVLIEAGDMEHLPFDLN